MADSCSLVGLVVGNGVAAMLVIDGLGVGVVDVIGRPVGVISPGLEVNDDSSPGIAVDACTERTVGAKVLETGEATGSAVAIESEKSNIDMEPSKPLLR